MHHMDIPGKPAELEQRDGRGARQGNSIAKQYYDNKVRNYIYAVEQSLDNYKFNLLKNKQTFISQMKNCELNVRTLDEGAMDEKERMNFSEYIAILSGDTSLLEKTKIEIKLPYWKVPNPPISKRSPGAGHGYKIWKKRQQKQKKR